MAWRPEVFVDGGWNSNSLIFESQWEAETYAKDLYNRWTLTSDHRAIEVDEVVNYKLDPQTLILKRLEDTNA